MFSNFSTLQEKSPCIRKALSSFSVQSLVILTEVCPSFPWPIPANFRFVPEIMQRPLNSLSFPFQYLPVFCNSALCKLSNWMQPCVNLEEQRKRNRVLCLYHIETEFEGGNDVTARQMDIFRLNKWAYLITCSSC